MEKSITVATPNPLGCSATHRRHPIERDPNRCVCARAGQRVAPGGFGAAHAPEIETLPRMMNRFSLGCNRNECKEASSNDVPIPL
ncbi:hypothetical protein CEXT_309621 [Caerostris extrusa]|uniref:Uncharacterized protein n=1 Tax=Caerostris extrusa TaxID=172846 RepID=A0AAV4NIY3_CAEEX|nr:hypothetical protein CEXT_309621 [Caerostris extrusa]